MPNIIVTGTPGCGKTSHSESAASSLGKDYRLFSISDIAKEHKFIESYDEKLDTSVVDEDKLLDWIEPELEKGGVIVDWHCCDIFPERLIDLVVVLRTDTAHLHDRMTKRGYKDNKIQANLDCEIMEVILQDAKDSYAPEIVIELASNSAEDMDENVDRVVAWAEAWPKDHPKGVTNELDPSVAAKRSAEESDEDDEGDENDVEDGNNDVEDDSEDDEDFQEEEEDDDDDEEEEYEDEE